MGLDKAASGLLFGDDVEREVWQVVIRRAMRIQQQANTPKKK